MALPDLSKILEIAGKLGVEVDYDSVVNSEETQSKQKRAAEVYSNALETSINTLHHMHASMTKKCLWCKETFITTYCYHQFCSDECRVLEFVDHFKIHPDKLKPPQSFWQYEEPGQVSVEFSAELYGWAKALVAKFESEYSPDQIESLIEEELIAESEKPPVETPLAVLDDSAFVFDFDTPQTPAIEPPSEDYTVPTNPQSTPYIQDFPALNF
jgi:uncharacterized protein YejL (UPF0352 family)